MSQSRFASPDVSFYCYKMIIHEIIKGIDIQEFRTQNSESRIQNPASSIQYPVSSSKTSKVNEMRIMLILTVLIVEKSFEQGHFQIVATIN